MGWLYYASTRRDLIADRTKTEETDTHKFVCLKHCTRGNVLWTVWQITDKATGEYRRLIGCDLMQAHPVYGWGYKDLDESMGPCYYTCPLSYLDLVPVKNERWRESVRKYAADTNALANATKARRRRLFYGYGQRSR